MVSARGLLSSVLALATTVGGAAGSHAQTPTRDTRPIVGILYFTNGAIAMNGVDYAPLSKGIAQLMIVELSQRNPGIRLVERELLQKLLDEQNLSKTERVDPQTAVRLGQVLGARHMLRGAFIIDPRQRMALTVDAIDTETSEIVYSDKVEGNADDVFGLITRLGEKVNTGLKLPALRPSRETEKPAASAAPSRRAALRAALALGSGMEAQDGKDFSRAIAHVREAAQLAPRNSAVLATLARLEQSGPK